MVAERYSGETRPNQPTLSLIPKGEIKNPANSWETKPEAPAVPENCELAKKLREVTPEKLNTMIEKSEIYSREMSFTLSWNRLSEKLDLDPRVCQILMYMGTHDSSRGKSFFDFLDGDYPEADNINSWAVPRILPQVKQYFSHDENPTLEKAFLQMEPRNYIALRPPEDTTRQRAPQRTRVPVHGKTRLHV